MTNPNDIEGLMGRLHPNVQELVKKSLQVTLFNMIAFVRDDKKELEAISEEFSRGEHFGSW